MGGGDGGDAVGSRHAAAVEAVVNPGDLIGRQITDRAGVGLHFGEAAGERDFDKA